MSHNIKVQKTNRDKIYEEGRQPKQRLDTSTSTRKKENRKEKKTMEQPTEPTRSPSTIGPEKFAKRNHDFVLSSLFFGFFK